MIIFLYGEDSLNSFQKLAEIKEKFLKTDTAGSGLSVFDFSDKKNINLLDVFETPNLLAPKRLVIAKRLIADGSGEQQENIKKYLDKNLEKLEKDKDLVIVFWEEILPKKNNALFKLMGDKKNEIKKQNFEKLNGAKLVHWVVKRIKELNEKSGISEAALEKLILYTGGDMHNLDNEIQKLVNFSAGKVIQEKDVELLVRANIDSNIFDTIGVLAANRKKEAMRLLENHLRRGEDPFYILSMFVYQFRNLLKVADLKEKNGIGSDQEIARISGLHPFVVRKSLSQIRNFDLEKLKKIYQRLSNLDAKVKTGKIDIKLALSKFIVEL